MKRKNVTTQMMKGYMAEALLLLMQKKDYLEISIGEITDKAGVNRSTYYRNFSSKEEVAKFWFWGLLRGYSEDYQKSDNRSFENYMLTMFSHFYKHKRELLLLHKNGLSYIILETLNQIFAESQTDDLGIDEEYRICFHIGGIYNTFVLWFSHDMSETPEELTRISLAGLPEHAKPTLLELFLR